MSLKPKRKNSNNIIDRDIDKMDSVSPSLSTSWKPKTRFSSPGSHGGDNINKNKKSIIPPGSLIDEESLNALTNNLSRHTDAKVSGNSVSRNAVAGNGNNTHRKMPSSPSLFFKKKSKFNNNNKLLPAANISKSTSMPKIEVPEISQSPFPRINKPTFEIQDLPDPFRTPVRHIRNVPSSEPRIKFPTSSISRLSSPPRVQPFAYNQSPRQRKNLLGIRCVFCDEPLESVLTSTDISEKIIELKCGDTCHEQCFNVAIEFSTVETPKNIVIEEETFDDLGKISNGLKNTNGRSIFPICKKCNQEAIPSDDNTADSILTKQLLENSKISLPTSISKKDQNKRITTTPKLRLSPSIISSTTPSSSSRKGKIRPNSDLSIDIPDKRLVASGIASLHHRKASRGSSISAMSSIISSASKSPISSPTSTKTKVFSSIHTQKSFNNSIPLALLRSRFIADLTRNFEKQKVKREISESIVDSFGLLRLADKLLVSKDGKNWSNKYCYLFSFQLLIVNSDYNDYYTIKLANNVDHNASSPASSPAGIKANVSLQTPKPSVLKIEALNADDQYLSSDNASVVEKWGAALSDLEMLFPNEFLTGTIELSDIGDEDCSASTIQRNSLATTIGRDENFQISDVNMASLSANLLNISTRSSYFPRKSQNAIILILNQYNMSQNSVTIFKNIIRALALIELEIFFVSTEKVSLSLESGYKSKAVILKNNCEQELIDALDKGKDNSSFSNQEGNLSTVINEYLAECKYPLEQIATVVLSNLSLNLNNFPTIKNIFIEIGVVNNKNSPLEIYSYPQDRTTVKLNSWDDVMERICGELDLSFDRINDNDQQQENRNSIKSIFGFGFGFGTGTGKNISPRQSEDSSLKKQNLGLPITDDFSKHDSESISSESDSDAEVIDELLENFDTSDIDADSTTYKDTYPNTNKPVDLFCEAINSEDKKANAIENIDTSALNPRIWSENSKLNYKIESRQRMDNSSGRWSSLFSDIDRALYETSKSPYE